MPGLPKRITYIARGGATRTRRLNHAIHRAFVQWFERARHRFAIPVRLVQVRKDFIVIAVCTDTTSVAGYALGTLSLNRLPRFLASMVSTSMLQDNETLCWIPGHSKTIARTSAGWFCHLCPPESRSIHPSREAAWIAHLFEPFLAHMNHTSTELGHLPEASSPPPEPAPHLLRLLIGPEAGEWSLEAVPSPTRGDSKCRLHP